MKRNPFKRPFALGLAGAMALSMAACGSSSSSTASSTVAESASESAESTAQFNIGEVGTTTSADVPTITLYPRDANLTSGLVGGYKGDYFASRGFNVEV